MKMLQILVIICLMVLGNSQTFANLSYQDKLAFVLENGYGRERISKIVLSDLDGKNAKILEQIQGTIYSLSVSADGHSLIYSQQSGKAFSKVYQLTINNGEKQLLTDDNYQAFGASLSPDKKQLLVSHSGGGNPDIYLHSREYGQIEQLTHDIGMDLAPIWLPNQQGFLFTSNREAGLPQIYHYTFADKSIKKVSVQGETNRIARISPDGRWVAWVHDKNWVIYTPLTENITVKNNNNTTILANLYEPVNFSADSQQVLYVVDNMIVIQPIKSDEKMVKISLEQVTDAQGENIGQGSVREPVWVRFIIHSS